jgi:outer membrane protein assembly factor BamB
MRASWAMMVVGLAVAAGCTKKPDPATEAVAETRAEKCERVASETGRTAQLAMGLLAHAVEDDPAAARASAHEAKGEVAELVAKTRSECISSWSDEQVRCMAEPLYALRHADECERAMSAAAGEPMPPDDVPAGPKATWAMTFEGTPSTLRLRADGLLVARFSDYESGEGDAEGTWYRALVGVRDGKQLWSHEGRYDDNLVVVDDDTYVAVSEGKVIAFDPATGVTKWEWVLPTDGIEDYDPQWSSPPWAAVVAKADDALLVGDQEARWYTVRADGTKGAFVTAFEDETLDSDARLLVGPDGLRWLWEGDDLRAFDAQWQQRVGLRAHESLSDVVVGDGEVTVLLDGEVMAIEADKCASEAQWVSPSSWPHPGEMTFSGEDDCEDCAKPPTGCVKWAVYVADVSREPMGVMADGGFVVSDGTETVAVRGGAEAWRAATGAGGTTVVRDGVVHALLAGGASFDDEPPVPWKLWALEAGTGKHQWGSTLTGGTTGLTYSTDEVHLATSGPWLVAGYGDTVEAFDLRR